MAYRIPFNKPFVIGQELYYIAQSVLNGQTGGDGPFSRQWQTRIGEIIKAARVLLTTSSASALEMAAVLCKIEPGEEVIVSSFAGPSACNAFLARGARLIFFDILPDTLNINHEHFEQHLSDRTRVVVARHYAGTACELGRLMALSVPRGIQLVEDVSEGFGAS